MQHIIIALLCFAGDYIWPAYYQWPAYELQPITVEIADEPEPVELPLAPPPPIIKPVLPPKAEKVVRPVVDFYTAKSCGPCRVAKPLLATAKQAGTLPFEVNEIDIDKHPREWTGSIPAFVWSVKQSPQYPAGRAAIVGWYGVDHLIVGFNRTTK